MFKLPDTFEIEKPAAIENEAALKQLFGIELAKKTPFEAACAVCGNDTNRALFVMQNWLTDPIVIAAKDKYKETAEASTTLLDKDQLAAKLLRMAEEKNANNSFYLLDGKDRLKALELYADIKGYKNKENNTSPVLLNNQMIIKLVEPERKEAKTIDSNDAQIQNPNPPVKLKLVG